MNNKFHRTKAYQAPFSDNADFPACKSFAAGNEIQIRAKYNTNWHYAKWQQNGADAYGYVDLRDWEKVEESYLRPVATIKAPPIAGAKFGAARSNGRYHAAADFAHYSGTPVYAAIGGYIKKYYFYWEGTCAIDVENDDGTVFRYGEIQANSDLGLTTSSPARDTPTQNVNIRIERGTRIGTMYPNTDSKASMLHLEHYKGTATGNLSQSTNSSTYDYVPIKNYQRRRDLLDPTPIYDLPTW